MERRQIPTDYDLWGSAVVCLDQFHRLIVVVEPDDRDRPQIGKFAGMISIPMGAIDIDKRETAPQAAAREFGEETGQEVRILYPIGFFEIVEPNGQRCGVWAFYGELTGKPYLGELEDMKCYGLAEKEFLRLDPFTLRPLAREIYACWKWIKLAIDSGKPIQWVWDMVKSYAPAIAKRLLNQ